MCGGGGGFPFVFLEAELPRYLGLVLVHAYGIARNEELEASLGSWKQHTKVTEIKTRLEQRRTY